MLVEKLTEVHDSYNKIRVATQSLMSHLSDSVDEDRTLMIDLRLNLENVEVPIIQLPVIGRVNAGKSTLLSAIMGPSTNEDFKKIPPLHIDQNEATAVVIKIFYGEIPAVRLEEKLLDENGKKQYREIDFEHYLNNFKASQNQEEHQRKFDNVKGFYVQYPNELLKLGLVLEDLPGLEMNEDRTQIALDTIRNRSIGIFVFDHRFSMNDHTSAIFRNFKKENCRIITVFNHKGFDLETEEGQESRYSIAKQLYELVTGRQHNAIIIDQTETIIKDLQEHDLFFVDAKRAWNGKVESKLNKIEDSGINTLEKLLGTLVSDEMKEKIKRGAEDKLMNSLKTRSNQLQRQIDQLTADINVSEEKIDAQSKLNETVAEDHTKVRDIVMKYRNSTEKEILHSLNIFLNTLPEKIIKLVFNKDYSLFEVSFELKGDIEKFITNEISTWQEQEVAVILLGNKTSLESELIHFRKVDNGQAESGLALSKNIEINSSIPAWERVLATAGGLFTGGIVSAAAGATMGTTGAIVTVASKAFAIGIGIALGAHLVPLIIGIMVAEAVGMAMLSDSIKESIKNKVFSNAKDTIKAIEKETKSKITSFVHESYKAVLTEVDKSFNEMIASDEKELATLKSLEKENQKKYHAAIITLSTKKDAIDTTIHTIEAALN